MTTVRKQFDVQRIVPFANIPVASVQLALNAKTLSDAFRASTVASLVPGLTLDDTVTGNVLDYNYKFKIDEITQNGGRINIDGRYNSNKLLYSLIDYELSNADRLGFHNGDPVFPVSAYFNALAGALGLTPRFYCRDWAVKPGTISSKCTYQQALQALFGWYDLAHIDVNVFIRGNNLFCVQRGRETSVITAGYGRNITLLDASHVRAEPTFTRHRIRTEWQGTTESAQPVQSNDIVDDTPEPFTGTISFGGNSLTYSDGYLMQEVAQTATPGAVVTTYYTYVTIDGKRYLEKKERFDDETLTCSKTVYNYVTHNGVLYLATETLSDGGQYSTGGGSPDYSNANITITEHVPLGNGWYGTTVRDKTTGEISTSLGQGGPANAVTKYTVEQSQAAMDVFTSTYSSLAGRILASLLGTPIVRTSYPVDSVYGLSDIRWLAAETDRLNNMIEETVNLDVVNTNRVIDFTDKITYRGIDYVLQSNTVNLTPNGVNQNVTLVRWYAD